jgi:CheY-like chemotaxis protein
MVRILVVDDEPVVRGVVAELLTDAGYAVACAADGEQAIETIHHWRPDAVLLDLRMPGVNGWAFLDTYRSDPICRGVPVGIMSAASDADRTLTDAGVLAVIRKPFDVDELLSTVDDLVRHSSLRLAAESTVA